MIDPSTMRALGLSHPPYNPINYDTSFHRFNREASRRQLFTRALIVGLVVAGVVLWRVL